MKKLLTVSLVVMFLAATASATLVPKMDLQWSEGRLYAANMWTSFGTTEALSEA